MLTYLENITDFGGDNVAERESCHNIYSSNQNQEIKQAITWHV